MKRVVIPIGSEVKMMHVEEIAIIIHGRQATEAGFLVGKMIFLISLI